MDEIQILLLGLQSFCLIHILYDNIGLVGGVYLHFIVFELKYVLSRRRSSVLADTRVGLSTVPRSSDSKLWNNDPKGLFSSEKIRNIFNLIFIKNLANQILFL